MINLFNKKLMKTYFIILILHSNKITIMKIIKMM